MPQYGNRGTSIGSDPTIRKGETGHPLRHQMTTAIPTSQCMICHMHQPNLFLNTYLGYTMWDYETARTGDVAQEPEISDRR